MTSAFSWQNFISLCLLHSVFQGQICLLLQVFLKVSRSGAVARRRYPKPLSPRPEAAGGRSYRMPEARVGGQEDQPHSVAAGAQEGLEELSHVEGQEGWR